MDGAMAPPPVLPRPPLASLYVGDLDPGVSEVDLHQAFAGHGLVSVRVCRDSRTGVSLRYGYVNFPSHSHAEDALKALNHTPLHGKPMRIMWSQRDPYARKTGLANLYVKNLDESVGGAKLEEMFGKFGTVVSCKVATTEDGRCMGFGFVQFDREEAAEEAIKVLNGSQGHGSKKLYVCKFVNKLGRQTPPEEPRCSNLYIKNLDHDFTDDQLQEKFSEFGKVSNAVVVKDELGKSRGFGFVSFELSEHAKKAMEAMNGVQLGSKRVYVGEAQKKVEREELLKRQFQCPAKVRNSNVYVKNLDVSVDEKALQKLFTGCGKIVSAVVMRGCNGLSRGFGFVSFSNPEEAKKAVSAFHGIFFLNRRLYVAMAQRKEDRRKVLQLRFGKQHSAVDVLPQGSSSSAISPHQRFIYQQPPSTCSTTNQGWQIPPSSVLPYQQRQMRCGNANWVKELPYFRVPFQPVPSVFQFQYNHPVHTTKKIYWSQPGRLEQDKNFYYGYTEVPKLLQYGTVEKNGYPSKGRLLKGSKHLKMLIDSLTPEQQKPMTGQSGSSRSHEEAAKAAEAY